MKNTFKKIIATVLSTAILIANTATFSVCAVEEETTVQKYTVEDLLPMSSEEICELLGDEAYAYKSAYKTIEEDHLLCGGYDGVWVEVIDSSVYLTAEGTVDIEYLFEDLGLDIGMYDKYTGVELYEDYTDDNYDTIYFNINYMYYTEYDFRHVFGCVLASIRLNSNVNHVRPNLYAGASKGDADKNGKVNAMDATMAARYAVGEYSLDNYSLRNADVNCDYEVNALDATLIARYAVGYIDSFE